MGFSLGRIAAVSRFHPWRSPQGYKAGLPCGNPYTKKANKKGAHWTPSQK